MFRREYSLGCHGARNTLAVVVIRGICIKSIDVDVNSPGFAEDSGQLLFQISLFVVKVVTDCSALLARPLTEQHSNEPSFL